MGKKRGNVLDFLTILITILAMSVLISAFLECTNLMIRKLEISQISRKYILKMETEGYLTEAAKGELLRELEKAGLRQIDISGTTLHPVAYGEPIYLKIKGNIQGRLVETEDEIWNKGFVSTIFRVEEEKVSTAKN